jgi:hypothetical protein
MKKIIVALLILSCDYASIARTVTVSSITVLQTTINNSITGDTIILANGVYLNNVINVSKSNLTIKAATPGGVFLNGTNSINLNGNYITFSGFQFTTGSIGSSNLIQVNGSNNILTQLNFNGYLAKKYIEIKDGTQYNQITYCNIENKPDTSIVGAVLGCAIQISTSPTIPGYHKIRYCSFQNFPGPGGDYGNEPIRLGLSTESTNTSRTVVEYCYFNNTGMGDGENISIKCCENVIRYCTFTNNPNGMLVFRNGNRNIAYGNFFINGSGGIRVKEANDIYCYNNYFESSGTSGGANAIAFNYISPNLNNINFLYNTFINCGDIDLGGAGPVNVNFTNNIFKKNTGNIFSNPNTNTIWKGNMYQGTLGIPISSGMTAANPLLALNTNNSFSLSSISPAINISDTTFPSILDIANVNDDPLLLLDIRGKARPTSIRLKDIGCDEFTTGAITNAPLTLSSVGPSYLAVNCSAPSTPTGLAVSSNTCNSTTLTWNLVSGPGITYEILSNNVSSTSNYNSLCFGPLTGTTCTISANPGSTNYYVVIARNACGYSLKSNSIAVTTPAIVTPAISISASPSAVICKGTSVTFTASPFNGGSSPIYQWKKNGVNIATGTKYTSTSLISGETITCVLTSNLSCTTTSTVTSNSLNMTVNSIPTVTISPTGSQTMCAGQTKKLSASTSAGITYQWQRNNVNITGATTSSHFASQAGAYRVCATNTLGCNNYSSTANITVNCRISNNDSIQNNLDENLLTNISIAPNPSSSEFNIDFKSQVDFPITICIFDVSGRILVNESYSSTRNFKFGSEFIPGIYLVRINSGDQTKTFKVIKDN